jgi:tRNA A-37 threonylcarbamoyl transferase component Bud32
MKELVNSYLGQYYLTEVIGRGSTSVVYKAYQSSLNRYVAIKVLTNYADPQFAVRFKREAHAVAQLQHPNILPIYDYGEQGSISYFVTQYVEGSTTLADMLAGRPSEPLTALALMQPLLSALTYAHGHGVVHRDIKPANIMMPRPDWPMLADFGIAKLLDDSQQLTPPGQSVGTAIYMAPERATTSTADVRTDLYSIGVVLYEMLTGQVPFSGVSPVEVLRKHVRTPPPPPTSINPSLPAPLEPVLLRALEKNPADRYQSAAELSQALERARGQIERLNAQRQLQQMLQQPAAGRAATPNPYQTRTLPPLTETADWIGTASAPRGGLRAGLIAVLLLAAIGGLVIFGAARGLARNGDQAGAPTIAAGPTSGAPAAIAPTAAPLPTAAPTGLPAVAQPPAAAPTTPPAPPAAASTPQILQQGQQIAVRLEDTDWQGGYRRPAGRTYGGRTATWVYGTSTPYSAMEASFEVAGQPAGRATLTIEGMDSEDRIKTPISIQVNGAEIFSGPNPLPDDDHPLETGTWASYSWTFDAALLRPGHNQIKIANLAEGAFSLPPFFMLDYADLSYQGS